jgi:hypothetical protein
MHGVQRSVAAMAAFLCFASPALAQAGGAQGGNSGGGTTSGPAAGTPATLGTGGETPASPHQINDTRNHGGKAIRSETGNQSGGAGQAGAKGAPGGKNGPPAETGGH